MFSRMITATEAYKRFKSVRLIFKSTTELDCHCTAPHSKHDTKKGKIFWSCRPSHLLRKMVYLPYENVLSIQRFLVSKWTPHRTKSVTITPGAFNWSRGFWLRYVHKPALLRHLLRNEAVTKRTDKRVSTALVKCV